MKRNKTTVSNTATTASNGTTSSQAAPHSKNAAQRNRSDSPYQGRTAQKDNPTQLIIKQAVDFLIQQVEAGKSETLAAYLSAMARFATRTCRYARCGSIKFGVGNLGCPSAFPQLVQPDISEDCK